MKRRFRFVEKYFGRIMKSQIISLIFEFCVICVNLILFVFFIFFKTQRQLIFVFLNRNQTKF